MSKEHSRLAAEVSRFPEYGGGGDAVGARRARHTFRWCVAACVFLTVTLWLSERFLRYEQPERLYLSGITKPEEQARVFLRQAVRLDEAKRESPTPKYLYALAAREQSDMVLATYEKAHQVDPGNWALAVRYGVELFRAGRADEARDVFQAAAVNSPNNALPVYLQAAVLPWTSDDADPTGESAADDEAERRLRKSLALVARTNSSGKSVVYPRPMWSSDLPMDGYWYAGLSRQVVIECSDPLYRFADFVAEGVPAERIQEDAEQWASWLGHLETMGRKVMRDAVPLPGDEDVQPTSPAAQARVGLYIQLAAIRRREALDSAANGSVDEARLERRIQLENVMRELGEFEEERGARLAAARTALGLPARLLLMGAVPLLFFWFAGYLLVKSVRPGTPSNTIPHTRGAYIMLGTSATGWFAVLCLAQVFAVHTTGGLQWLYVLQISFAVFVCAVVLFGIAYPWFALPSARAVCSAEQDHHENQQKLASARRCRRATSWCLYRRYFGIAVGLLVCAACFWAIEFRIATSLYPWQVELLAPGLMDLENEIVARAVAGLV